MLSHQGNIQKVGVQSISGLSAPSAQPGWCPEHSAEKMASSPAEGADQEPQAPSKDPNVDSDNPDEHMDHTYSCDIPEGEIPYSALSPDTIALRRKIRHLHRRAQRQKHKIKCMKQLIKQLKAST